MIAVVCLAASFLAKISTTIQDYTAFQLAYLKVEFPRAKFTMLGDLNLWQILDRFLDFISFCCLSNFSI